MRMITIAPPNIGSWKRTFGVISHYSVRGRRASDTNGCSRIICTYIVIGSIGVELHLDSLFP